MNKSINATLSRTVITSGLVFLTVFVLFLFGGEVNRSFAFTFAVGIITEPIPRSSLQAQLWWNGRKEKWLNQSARKQQEWER